MLAAADRTEWRAWAVLERIGYVTIDANSEGLAELKTVSARLCLDLESRLGTLANRWELGNVAAKLCTIAGMDEFVLRLLHIVSGMETQFEKEPIPLWPPVDQPTLVSLQRIAEADDHAFEGFLKIFPPISSARESHPDYQNEILQSDISRALRMARASDRAVQRGAITFLAENANKDVSSTTALLQCCLGGEIPQRWGAQLVRGTAHQLKPDEAMAFLVPILRPSEEYPPAIRAAALNSARDMVKLLNFELPEARLGLPF
jgi:hypothetical protein